MSNLKLGEWKFICDICGFEYHSNEARRTWDGLITCKDCWEPKHPQLEITGIPDDQTIPWTRGELEIEINFTGQLNLDTPSNYFEDLITMGSTDGLNPGDLIDSNNDFVVAGVQAGDIVHLYDPKQTGYSTPERATVVSVNDEHVLTLSADVVRYVGQLYRIRRST